MDFIKQNQTNVMLVLSGICGTIALFVYMTDNMSKRRKTALLVLELSAMFMLLFDRWAYIYRGDTSSLGWWMVRISNFMVFFLILLVIFSFNQYLIDLFALEGKLETTPKRLVLTRYIVLFGMIMVIVSQFTGVYYTFDESNRYQRSSGFILCYLIPFIVMALQSSVIIQYRKRLSRGISVSILLFTAVSLIASIGQVFLYGISLNNIAIVAAAALLYVLALKDMNRKLEHARNMEIEFYKKEKEHAMFDQTAQALVSAIDAKDKYTRGHSARVAAYSLQIARAAGKSPEECDNIYFAALLHDVGKIGIDEAIINKAEKLTPEEYDKIKMHSLYGYQILSTIKQSPHLNAVAHYHHERYDGKGYPEGIAGDNIPDMARIIAVADSYDAMTSRRSYRDPMPQEKVREELINGSGSQFDPQYAAIMVDLIDRDPDYTMREKIEA